MTTQRDYSHLLDCTCTQLRSAARRITQTYEAHLKPAGVSPPQFSILAALANIGPVPLSDLAQALALERTGLSRNLQVLERKGWVHSGAGEDSRQRLLSLTDQGRAQLHLAMPLWLQAQNEVTDLLGASHLHNLKSTLDALTR